MVIQVRLEVPIELRDGGPPKISEADAKVRAVAAEMGVQVSTVKIRADVVQLYGSKVA